MQIANFSMNNDGMPLQALFNKSRTSNQSSSKSLEDSYPDKIPFNYAVRNANVEEAIYLQEIQREFQFNERLDSYLGKLQKVLENFKEFNKKIAQEALTNAVPDNNRSLQNKMFHAKNAETLIKEFPMLQEFEIEAGNYELKSFIAGPNYKKHEQFGNDILNISDKLINNIADNKLLNDNIDKLISKVNEKHLELWNSIKKIENSFDNNKLEINSLNVGEMINSNKSLSSKAHKYLKQDIAIKLLS